MPMPSGGAQRRALEHRADDRPFAQGFVEERGDVLGHHRHQHEQAPHAVDDRGDAGQQFDGGTDRATQPARRDFGEEEGDAEADRHGDDHRDERGDQGAVDRGEGAELVFDRIPVGGEEEAQALHLQGMAAAPQHGQRGAGQGDQDEDDGADQHPSEQFVVAGITRIARGRGCYRLGDGIHGDGRARKGGGTTWK